MQGFFMVVTSANLLLAKQDTVMCSIAFGHSKLQVPHWKPYCYCLMNKHNKRYPHCEQLSPSSGETYYTILGQHCDQFVLP